MPSDNTPEPLPTPEAINTIRQQVRDIMAADKLTGADVAREAAVPYGTFSSWLNGTYAGRNDRIAQSAQRWLEAREARQQAQALAPVAPGFVMTQTAEDLWTVLRNAQYLADMSVFVGPPGTGKTKALRAYEQRTPNVYVMTGSPSVAGPRAVTEELCRMTGLPDRGQPDRMQRALALKLRGAGALLVIDEAQHLTSVALDQVRSLHDAAEVGVALVGNPAIFARLEGEGRSAHFAQLYSRVGMRMTKRGATKADVDALLDAWAVQGAEERKLLHWIARKPGALRSMTKTLMIAHMLAATERVKPTPHHIRDAYERLSGSPVAEAA